VRVVSDGVACKCGAHSAFVVSSRFSILRYLPEMTCFVSDAERGDMGNQCSGAPEGHEAKQQLGIIFEPQIASNSITRGKNALCG